MGLIDDVLGVIGAIFAIAIGVILMQALYPINPFMAIVGIILLFVVAAIVVLGFAKSHGRGR